MKLSENGVLVRIFISENDTLEGKALYELIVLKAKEIGLAGATVFRGVMGFGYHSKMHTSKILRLSEELPLVVEIIDSRENLAKLLPFLDETVKEGLVTMENVEVIKYRENKK
ncbi:MAG: DUF190 domain-containing protein [Nitrospinota bacterium]|nr:DUF190 domain-containing protein [Nitrospinota bacterium]